MGVRRLKGNPRWGAALAKRWDRCLLRHKGGRGGVGGTHRTSEAWGSR